jgi:hypothetical protein
VAVSAWDGLHSDSKLAPFAKTGFLWHPQRQSFMEPPGKEPDQKGSASHTSHKDAVLPNVVSHPERFISRKKVNLGSDIK